MKKLKQVKEIKMIDQFIAITDLLEKLGYETSDLSELTLMDVAHIRYDLLKSIESLELKEQYC